MLNDIFKLFDINPESEKIIFFENVNGYDDERYNGNHISFSLYDNEKELETITITKKFNEFLKQLNINGSIYEFRRLVKKLFNIDYGYSEYYTMTSSTLTIYKNGDVKIYFDICNTEQTFDELKEKLSGFKYSYTLNEISINAYDRYMFELSFTVK